MPTTPERNSVTIFATTSWRNHSDFGRYCFRDNGAGFDDWSAEGATIGGTAKFMWQTNTQVMYFGADAQFKRLGFYADTFGSYGARTWAYWSGAAWVPFTPVYDGTAGFSKHGYVEFGTIGPWAGNTVGGQAGFWIKVTVASVATAAKIDNLLVNANLAAPVKLSPDGELDYYARDINAEILDRDIPNTKPQHLGVQCTRRALELANLHLLRYIKSKRLPVFIRDEAQTATPNFTNDSYFLNYTGRLTKVDPRAAAVSKMDLGSGYALEFEISTATELLS